MRVSLAKRGRDAIDSAFAIWLASLGAACAGVTVLLCADLVWTDLLHVNAGRTASESLGTMLASPIFGLVFGVLWFALPVTVEGIVVVVVILRQGRLSRAGLASAAVVATAFFLSSWAFTDPAIDDVSGEVFDGPPWSTLVGGSALIVASLYVGWQHHRRRRIAREAPANA